MYKIGTNDKGRAIYATSPIPKGKVVMRCPLIKFTPKETALLSKTLLAHYIFNWGNGCCLPTGYALLMNHSSDANIGWDEGGETEFLFVAKRNIAVGEELSIDYGYAPSSYTDSGVENMLKSQIKKSDGTTASVQHKWRAAAATRITASSNMSKIDIQTAIREHMLDKDGTTTAQKMFDLLGGDRKVSVSAFASAWKDLLAQDYLIQVRKGEYRWESVA